MTDSLERAALRDSFAYQWLRMILPMGIVGSVAAAAVIVSTYADNAISNGSYVLGLALAFGVIRYLALPRIRTSFELDLLSSATFGLAAGGTWLAAATIEQDSAISCSQLLTIAAFAFVRSWVYALFGIVCVGGYWVARSQSAYGIDIDAYHLVILGPAYALVVRLAVLGQQTKIVTTKRQLRSKILELEKEQELRHESDKHLVHAQKMEGLGLLAAGVAHDFNNHLQAISAFAELIGDKLMGDKLRGDKLRGDKSRGDTDVEDEARVFVGHIQSAVRSSADICRQMLAYAGKSQEAPSVFDVAAMVQQTYPILAASVPKQIDLRVISCLDGSYVQANPIALQQCLTNLVQNASDAVPRRDGRISVRVDRLETDPLEYWREFGDNPLQGRFVVIEVSDNGCGMDSQTLECAFDPYFTTKPEGHGFGLATTLGIVRSFGGVIRCQSNPKQGTRFQIVLPEASPPEPKSPASEEALARRTIQAILLVDNDEFIRDSVSRILRNRGYEVTCAGSSAQALAIVRTAPSPFDLLLMDYAMPDMTGIDLLEVLRSEGHTTRAAICSDLMETDIFNRSSVKPDAFLRKPFQVSELTAILEN